jgi:hypothetical protein
MKTSIYKFTLSLALSMFALTSWADVPISGLPAGTTLGGTEAIPAVQTAVTVKTTPAAINTYVQTQTTAATIVGKFTSCSGTKYLGADGACHTVSAGTTFGNSWDWSTSSTSLSLLPPTGLDSWAEIFDDGAGRTNTTIRGTHAGGGTSSTLSLSGLGDAGIDSTSSLTLTSPAIDLVGVTTFNGGVLSVSQGGTGSGSLTGILKGTGTSAFSAALSSDVIGLWTGTCNSSSFLRGDGSCAAASGGATLGANTFTGRQTLNYSNPSIDYYSTSGTSEEHWWRTEVSVTGDTWRLSGVSDNGLTVFDVISAVRFHNSIININFAGPAVANDTFTMDADTNFGTQVSNTAAAGDNDNYNPGGSIGSRTYFRITADATGSNITGFQSTSTRSIKYLWNVATVGNIVLKNNASGSNSGNRILTPGAADFTVRPGGGWMMIYDGSSSVWRILAN